LVNSAIFGASATSLYAPRALRWFKFELVLTARHAAVWCAPAKAPQTEQGSAPDEPAAPSAAAAAIAQYRSRVPVYDFEIALAEPMRRRALATEAGVPNLEVTGCHCGIAFNTEVFRAIGEFLAPPLTA